MPHQIDQESLEALCVAIMQLKNTDGQRLCIFPEDVLQDWIAQQCPRRFQLSTTNSLEAAYERVRKDHDQE